MEPNQNLKSYSFDGLLLVFAVACACLLIMTIGNNWKSEVDLSRQNNVVIEKVDKDTQKTMSAEKSYEEWLKRTSGGRKIIED